MILHDRCFVPFLSLSAIVLDVLGELVDTTYEGLRIRESKLVEVNGPSYNRKECSALWMFRDGTAR